MSVELRTASSEEMRNTVKSIVKMQGRMGFNGEMEKINWKMVRLISNMGYRLMKPQKGVSFQKRRFHQVKTDVSIPSVKSGENIIFHIHGGGCVSGSARASRGYCSQIAAESGLMVVSVEYRLAPEHPFPAGLDDVYAAYTGLRETYPNAKIAVIGESAGAYLALSLLVRCIRHDAELPSCLCLNSPIAMLEEGRNLGFTINPDTTTVVEEAFPALQRMYAAGADTKNPEISFVYDTNADRYPPMYITADAHELLRWDAEKIYAICEAAGIEAHMVILEGSFHAACTTGYGTPETSQILKESCEFMKAHF